MILHKYSLNTRELLVTNMSLNTYILGQRPLCGIQILKLGFKLVKYLRLNFECNMLLGTIKILLGKSGNGKISSYTEVIQHMAVYSAC